jgi:hypothetical protein
VKAALITVFFVLAFPPVSLAHGGGSQHGYVSTVERIVNAGGIEAQASGDGHFRFTAPAGRTVVVRGYEGEPYLRFAHGTVYENERSPTAYVNRDQAPPASAMAGAQPEWRQVATGRTHTWHDHRTHWMAANPPAAVARDQNVRHHISDWKVDGTVDGKRFEVVGSLDWAPTESGLGWKWLLLPLVGGAVVYALFVTFWARRPRSRPSGGATRSA